MSRKNNPSHRFFLSILTLIMCMGTANGQLLKKLGKAAERAAERTVERRVEKETEEKTDAALDSILEPGSQGPTAMPPPDPGKGPDIPGNTEAPRTPGPKTLKVYTNYDFVPGSQILLYDDFSIDNIGDFPAQWNTNGAGEIVSLENSENKWFKLSNNSVYVPDLKESLPEDYTLEFDMISSGLDGNISSNARLKLLLDDNNSLKQGNNYAEMSIPLAQYIDAGVYVSNYFNGENTIRNYIKKDVRQDVKELAHVAIAVNGSRFRMWMNERKLIDLPRFIEAGTPEYIKFELEGMPGESKEQYIFITNVKLAEGGEDLRSKLLKDGRFSTTGILFDPGSDRIRPESFGTLKLIADALAQESTLELKIVGHTDADGNDDSNMTLSQRRASAVKTALSSEFGVPANRLQTDGRGESEPVADNGTAEGKAQNRRVEFIKL